MKRWQKAGRDDKGVTMNWHPFAETFPMLEGDEWEEFKASIKATKGIKSNPILYRVVGKELQGLDGRNRERACKELGLKVEMRPVKVKDADVKDFVLRCNAHRRHLQGDKRKELILKLREAGESTRAIAESTGVSQKTVSRTVQVSQSDSPDSKTVGKDGKQYPKSKPKPTCDRCTRVGPTVGCAQCKELRAKPKTPKEDLAKDEPESETPEPTIEEIIKAKNSELESWCRGLMEYAKTMPDDPWLQDLNRREGALTKLKNCCETIRSAKCHCACPKCDGSGCRQCHQTGRVTKYAMDSMA